MASTEKAIYRPKGKAGEYAEFACNFYTGCSNGCEYCYCKKGVLAHAMGGDTPTLKKCFHNEDHALEVFEKELLANLLELQKHGLFFSFSTDPMLDSTMALTWAAVVQAVVRDVPVKILTKRADFIDDERLGLKYFEKRDLVAFGFTLTGHNELEPHASTNSERIGAMRKLHEAGFKTFASIEPVVNVANAWGMIKASTGDCDLYKIGLLAGGKQRKKDVQWLVDQVLNMPSPSPKTKIYFKDGLLKRVGIDRASLPDNCVGRDYNLFER